MTNLVSAYQRRDVHEAEKILRGPLPYSDLISCISDPTRLLQTTAPRSWTTPSSAATSTTCCEAYARSGSSRSSSRTPPSRSATSLGSVHPTLAHLAVRSRAAHLQQLRIAAEEVEDILVSLILDDKIQGRIDQVTQRLEIDRQFVPFPPQRPSATDRTHPQQGARSAPLCLARQVDRAAHVAPGLHAHEGGDRRRARPLRFDRLWDREPLGGRQRAVPSDGRPIWRAVGVSVGWCWRCMFPPLAFRLFLSHIPPSSLRFGTPAATFASSYPEHAAEFILLGRPAVTHSS